MSLNPVWNISRHFEIEAAYEFNQIEFSGRNQLLKAHLGRVNLTVALNNHFSTMALVQLNSLDKRWGANVKFRYNFREGQDLYLVYNQVKRSAIRTLEETQQFPDAQAITLKYTHTFVRK